jgi:uncharacterized protein
MNKKDHLVNIKPRVDKNVFIFRESDQYYLFAPLSRTYSVINEDMHLLLQLCNGEQSIEYIVSNVPEPDNILPAITKLLECGILTEEEHAEKDNRREHTIRYGHNGRFSIFPSTACNLKCKYCYANGGDHPRYIDEKLYQIAFRYFFANFPEDMKDVHLSIHGGGEPTLNYPLLRRICDEFNSQSKINKLTPKISITSNGTFNKEIRDWVISENIGISISLDGPSEIQDYQRPFRSGSGSFDMVMENVRYLIDQGRQIGIRSTVTAHSVSAMQDTLEMAKSEGIAAVHFEPLFETERSRENRMAPPRREEFTQNLLSCFLKGLEYDIDVSYSGLRCFDHPHFRFCSACGDNFGLTIDGHITTCYEVLELEDPASKCFFIGKVNVKEGTVDIDEEKVSYLKGRETNNLTGCRECLLKFNCAGDCAVKVYRACDGDIFGTNTERCLLAKDINKQVIRWVADGFIEPRDKNKSLIYTYDCGELS